MSKPKDWTAGSVLVALCAAVVACGAIWAVSPLAAGLTATHAGLAGLCVLVATRNLRARLENAERLLDAWNSSEARDELAKSPPAGTPSVALYDQDAPPDPQMHVYEVATGKHLCCDDPPVDLNRHVVTMRATPMTVAEIDRLVAQLQALPGEKLAPPRHNMFVGRRPSGDPLIVRNEGDDYWHLGQPCARCDAPATAWVSDRPDPEISDVTFLCDEHYAVAMSEEDGRE